MAWKDLHSELSEMFGALSSRSDEQWDALERRRAQRAEYMRQWMRTPQRRRYNRQWMSNWRQDPENRKRQQQRQRESRARLVAKRRAAGLPATSEIERLRSREWAKKNPDRMRELRRAWKQKKRQDPEYRAEVNRKERERRVRCSS